MSSIPGRTSSGSDWDSSALEKKQEAEEVTGLDLDEAFDDVRRDYSLDRENPAAVEFRTDDYSEAVRTVLKLHQDFSRLPDPHQLDAMIHEGVHGLDGKNRLIPQLREKKGVSEEFVEEASRFSVRSPYASRRENEGFTQALTKQLDPNGELVSLYVYPDETSEVEKMLEGQGIDLEQELSTGQQDYHGRAIYSSWSTEDLYVEAGSYQGTEYLALVEEGPGTGYGNELADEYVLEELPAEDDIYRDIKAAS
ncbi:MAG: hypothetical protein ABEK01_04420 [Candidatus Nanohaloarchaea archaeon]